MASPPRVTLGVATYERDAYLGAAVASCLAQDYRDLEVLVVLDGGRNPRVEEALSRFSDPRLRVIRHDVNRGISEAYNTIVGEGRGELIAMLGDDDVCAPDRIRRQVQVFDAHPDTGVVHGDAKVIDERGRRIGEWRSGEFARAELLRYLVRVHNPLVDPTRMVHRRVYDAVGGYHPDWTLAQDFHFWLRAAPEFRFRHLGGAPLIELRRHGDNFSDESAFAKEVAQVEAALRETVDRLDLRTLVPELDWPILHPHAAEARALHVLADALDARKVPASGLAAELRARAARVPAPPAPRRDRGRLLMTAFGWNDSGGGTTIPRVAAKELVRRGWDVTVFHAATGADPSGIPYAVREWEEDGVRLVGVHNRQHGLWDLGNPLRELDDPPITAAFSECIDRFAPDVVHFHNLHNLGAALIDVAAARGVPAYFTTHNYWTICPRAYLLRGDGSLCGGPGTGADCASCAGSWDERGHEARLAGIRERFARGIDVCMAVSSGVRRTLANQGYDPDGIDVVRQCVPAQDEVWESVGAARTPGRVGDVLTVGFFGSAYPHKGPQLLVEAAQRVTSPVRVLIHGELPRGMGDRLRKLDRRGVVELCGAFSPSELPGLLAGVDAAVLPSLWWDCAPLAAGECLAARVPVVAPRMGGLAEAIRDGVDGLAFAGGDVADLAAQIECLASEDGLLERLRASIEPPRGFAAWIDELEAYYAGERPSRTVEEPTPAVRWQGDHDLKTSLSTINREVGDRLRASRAVHLERVTATATPIDPPLPHTADVEVRHQWPPDFRRPAAGRLALIQPWEFGAIPVDWLRPLRETVDELWVPSAFVRDMYLDAGLADDRVHVVPNGVDTGRFRSDGPRLELPEACGVRFLFVGGAIWRKGIDVLVAAWRAAFPGGEDVSLVIKDFGAAGVYRSSDRGPVEKLVADDPRVVHLTRELDDDEMAGLFRACDVLVHPYRGEGFAMPVLEAMASGLPVIVTAGGPTDEFCPPEAGWRIGSVRRELPERRVDTMETHAAPWLLEPDPAHLVAALREAAGAPAERARRGAAGQEAAAALSWDAVAAHYAERIRALSARPPRLAAAADAPLELEEEAPIVLATPAWRGRDRLGELLAAWSRVATTGTLVLLADPDVDPEERELEARVLAAADEAGVDLDACADIAIRVERGGGGRDRQLLQACAAYVPLHRACAGYARLARAAGMRVVAPDTEALLGVLTAATPAAGAR